MNYHLVFIIVSVSLAYKHIFGVKCWFVCGCCDTLNKAHTKCTSLLDAHFSPMEIVWLTMGEYGAVKLDSEATRIYRW